MNHISTPTLRFLLLQAVLVATGAGWAAVRHQAHRAEAALPALRSRPRTVAARYDHPEIVTDAQLAQVLKRLVPPISANHPKINHVEHALRFWGEKGAFADPNVLSGKEQVRLLTNHGVYQNAWDGAAPLLVPGEHGIKSRVNEGPSASAHTDHTLAVLAECGVPTNYPLKFEQGTGTFRTLIEGSLRSFSLQQTEYEWSLLAYLLLLEPSSGFRTNEGQFITYEELADRAMRQPLGAGVCLGNHRLYSLAVMLQVDEQEDFISDAARERIVAHLCQATAALVASQSPQGYWGADWSGGLTESEQALDPQAVRILATGHALEWWAIAPPETHPPRETLVRAGQWLCRTIEELPEESIGVYYTYLSHAGRSLVLWRGQQYPVLALVSASSNETEDNNR